MNATGVVLPTEEQFDLFEQRFRSVIKSECNVTLPLDLRNCDSLNQTFAPLNDDSLLDLVLVARDEARFVFAADMPYAFYVSCVLKNIYAAINSSGKVNSFFYTRMSDLERNKPKYRQAYLQMATDIGDTSGVGITFDGSVKTINQ
jgi:hypothetical protein